MQRIFQLNYDTDSCGCADESRDEALKDRSREKQKRTIDLIRPQYEYINAYARPNIGSMGLLPLTSRMNFGGATLKMV